MKALHALDETGGLCTECKIGTLDYECCPNPQCPTNAQSITGRFRARQLGLEVPYKVGTEIKCVQYLPVQQGKFWFWMLSDYRKATEQLATLKEKFKTVSDDLHAERATRRGLAKRLDKLIASLLRLEQECDAEQENRSAKVAKLKRKIKRLKKKQEPAQVVKRHAKKVVKRLAKRIRGRFCK